ncbi:putative hydantoinase [Kockovaella imperatae]|uniref:Putative hydantoinase n=1 Tax=Kockovaella imperatae TaxID=4999 RepID=A0A1Y1US49_9TREE|nr:putative hydantoinase [Kockovaella imperatae]ORX40324.1 putative hydantoinase [Kockovaella imperatae]
MALRIGVDVGGTNTDAVVLDLAPNAARPVLASFKAQTTPDVTLGIRNAVIGCLKKADVDLARIQAVSIGTTSFVNALIERNQSRLQKVGAIRLCGAYSRLTPPFSGFPVELRAILEGPVFFAQGGLQVDGSEISTVDAGEIKDICRVLRERGVETVAVSGIYSPIDHEFRQEELVRAIIQQELPSISVSISKEIANLGLLERENATILNASLLQYAQKVVDAFLKSAEALGLACPVFLTSNDGTLMSLRDAIQYPIKTFSSGPTNSMRGAHFLASWASGQPRKETALVVDIGGTTTEVGVLLPTGFPRQAGAKHDLVGVSLNFSMPHVHSIGLGGGSRIRRDTTGKVTVGPDSVGYEITESRAFGGSTLTATDIVVAAGVAPDVGNPELVKDLDSELSQAAQHRMKAMLELVLDEMKTSSQEVPVYLVGGGAILSPESLRGISQVHRFPHADAANAVGAAVAQVSGVIDTFRDTSSTPVSEVRRQVEAEAIAKAVAAGSDPKTTVIVESEAIPIAYTAGRCRFYVKAAGDWVGIVVTSKAMIGRHDAPTVPTPSQSKRSAVVVNDSLTLPAKDIHWTAQSILSYRPRIVSREWILSEVDLQWIATGCYILGCGGGGSPDHESLALQKMIREGCVVRVVDVDSMKDGYCLWGGGIGSPEVSSERLMGEEYNESVVELLAYLKMDDCVALAALEIGGGNGMINMITAASNKLNLPVLDGDFMGRAYPTGWQTTPIVYDTGDRGEMMLPCGIASGDGSSIIMTKARHYKDVDSILRAGCVEMGTHAGGAMRPLDKDQCQQMMIKNTVSQAWRIGRAVALANKSSQLGRIGEILVDALGGPGSAKVLFSGKITEVVRQIRKGHSYGEVVIDAVTLDDANEQQPRYTGQVKIPFKNENLYCEHRADGRTEILATVPDLIAVIDSQSGCALGTPDYKYGLRVIVVAVVAAPQWTDTQRGMEIGGITSFGFDLPYNPVGRYVKPKSVIEEYGDP